MFTEHHNKRVKSSAGQEPMFGTPVWTKPARPGSIVGNQI